MVGALLPDPRRPGSVRIMVDGRLFCTVPSEVARAEGLAPGQVLDAPRLDRLGQAADVEAAYRTALRCLERRPFAARDLVRRLGVKGHPAAAAEAAVERAALAGLVDDARFAAHFVETRRARGRGPSRLRRDLAGMGVERRVIDAALQEAFGAEGPDADQVAALAERRLAQLCGLPRAAARRRLMAFLDRRGFGGPAVRNLVNRLVH